MHEKKFVYCDGGGVPYGLKKTAFHDKVYHKVK